MVFLWVVPVVAATAGVAMVLSRMRKLEDLSLDLVVELHRTRELRAPLAALRKELARGGSLVERVWAHWTDESSGTR